MQCSECHACFVYPEATSVSVPPQYFQDKWTDLPSRLGYRLDTDCCCSQPLFAFLLSWQCLFLVPLILRNLCFLSLRVCDNRHMYAWSKSSSLMPLVVSVALQSKESKTMLNNRGDSTHACLTPFLIGIGSLNLPLCEIPQFDSLCSSLMMFISLTGIDGLPDRFMGHCVRSAFIINKDQEEWGTKFNWLYYYNPYGVNMVYAGSMRVWSPLVLDEGQAPLLLITGYVCV
jgi:hypothetical protein